VLAPQPTLARPSVKTQERSGNAPRHATKRRARKVPIVRMKVYWPRRHVLVEK
jgi:hypothetical protein